MKNLLIIGFVFISPLVNSQTTSVLRLEKMSVSDCGCSIYMPKSAESFVKSYSEDSSLVYTGSFLTEDNFEFGAIAVKFKEPLGNDKALNEEMLTSYMDFIKTQFGVTASAGYGKGHTMEKYPNAIGVIDYWEDSEGNQIAVKGWIDGNKLSVLYIAGKTEYPVFNIQQMFLDGFRFD